MEQLKHVTHNHPLILNDDHTRADVVCYGCNQPIIVGSFAYSCSSGGCNFFLHEICAKLTETLKHPMHETHPPSLHSRQQYKERAYICNICWASNLNWFAYVCKECDVGICLICIFADGMFQDKERLNRNFCLELHDKQHSLTLIETPALFECDACGIKDTDSSFVCNSCSFWIHQSCALLPSTMKFSFHRHHLVLANSLPHQYRNFRQFCDICKNMVLPRRWLYYCVGCRYFAHLKCATSSNEQILESSSRCSETENDEADPDKPNMVHFPLPNEPSLDTIVRQFIEATSTLSNDTTVARDQIKHWAHRDHALVLFNNLDRNSTSPLLCDGCVGSISTSPFYGCAQCKFFLHEICDKLPSQLIHPSHNHNLVCGKYAKPNFYVIKCKKCKYICNGMFFSCDHCKFYLDVRCALLPDAIKHKSHSHPLDHHLVIFKCACNGCGLNVNGFFGCKDCDFHLCRYCTFMPRTIRHRWDPHPIRLVYPPIENHPEKFYCEICEVEINPNHWLYVCRACDQSFHTKCLHPYFAFSNMKFGATNIKVENHLHNFTFVGMKKHKFGATLCGNCRSDIPDGSPVLECEPCYFRLCEICSPLKDPACLLEPCERAKEPGPKFYSLIYKKVVDKLPFFIVLFCYIFILWVVYKGVLFLWVHPHLFICILVLWFGVFKRF